MKAEDKARIEQDSVEMIKAVAKAMLAEIKRQRSEDGVPDVHRLAAAAVLAMVAWAKDHPPADVWFH
jgi:hypothetical protein